MSFGKMMLLSLITILFSLSASDVVTLPYHNKSRIEKIELIKQIENQFNRSDDHEYQIKASIRAAEICYNLSSYRELRKWYLRAINLDPEVETSGLVQYRVEKAEKLIRRENQIYISLLIIVAVVLFSFFYSISNRKLFESKLFKKKLMPLLIIFTVSIAIFSIVDQKSHGSELFSYFNMNRDDVIRPIFPINRLAFESSMGYLIILIFGMMPFIVSSFLSSFRGKSIFPSLVSSFILMCALWSYYYWNFGYDTFMEKKMIKNGSHIYFMGEIEKKLLNDPEKLLKRNPNYKSVENSDLKIFMKENNIENIE